MSKAFIDRMIHRMNAWNSRSCCREKKKRQASFPNKDLTSGDRSAIRCNLLSVHYVSRKPQPMSSSF